MRGEPLAISHFIWPAQALTSATVSAHTKSTIAKRQFMAAFVSPATNPSKTDA